MITAPPAYVPPEARPYATTTCPHCQAEMSPLPKARAKCQTCGQPVHVRSGPDGMRHLLRLDQLAEMDASWFEASEGGPDPFEALTREARILTRRAVTPTLGLLDFTEEGWEQDVVGESHYQRELAEVTGRDRSGIVRDFVVARLRPEPTNTHDRNAVRVEVFGRLVGYIPREQAVTMSPLATEIEQSGFAVTCQAEIRGGNVGNDGRVYPIGIFLLVHPTEDWANLVLTRRISEITFEKSSPER